MKICPTLASAAGLLGGYKVASTTGNRPLGGAVLGLAGFIAFKNWKRKAGVGRATFLTGVYRSAIGYSQPHAQKNGAWPAVETLTGGTAQLSLIVGRKRKQK